MNEEDKTPDGMKPNNEPIQKADDKPEDVILDPFDPERLRLSQDFAATVGVKKALLTVPVRKPSLAGIANSSATQSEWSPG